VSLSTGRYQLYSALKDLCLHWDEVRPRWTDVVRQEFERDFWAQVEPRVGAALAAIDRLAQVMTRLKQECS
jgi:hypothetical protein